MGRRYTICACNVVNDLKFFSLVFGVWTKDQDQSANTMREKEAPSSGGQAIPRLRFIFQSNYANKT